jgi:hypothetical protein
MLGAMRAWGNARVHNAVKVSLCNMLRDGHLDVGAFRPGKHQGFSARSEAVLTLSTHEAASPLMCRLTRKTLV